MNHSCEPSCWFEGPKLMTATRDLAAGEEITFDYATSNDWDQGWRCGCGAAGCRGVVTGREWEVPSLQVKYRGHWLPHVAARIAALPSPPPLPATEEEMVRA